MIDIDSILNKHYKWLNNEPGGEEANLQGADLGHMSLQGKNLMCVNFHNANLQWANLNGASLYGADLSFANLQHTSLCGTNMHNAILHCAKLNRSDLSGANLYEAQADCADFSNASLYGTNLCKANLIGANFTGADVKGAIFCRAHYDSEAMAKFAPLACPEVGSFIGWKRLRGDKIAKLEVPCCAKRSSAYGRKIRCSEVNVLEIKNIDGDVVYEDGMSIRDSSFIYRVGGTLKVLDFDTNRWNECSNGIHLFLTRQEAVDYEF